MCNCFEFNLADSQTIGKSPMYIIRADAVVSYFLTHRRNNWSRVTTLELLWVFGFSQLFKKRQFRVKCSEKNVITAFYGSFFFKHVCQFPTFICAIIYFHCIILPKKCNLLNSNCESSKCSYNRIILLNIMLMICVTHWSKKIEQFIYLTWKSCHITLNDMCMLKI